MKPLRTLKRIEFWHIKGDVADAEKLRDMLRYDVAFMSDAYPGVVAFPTFQTRGSGLHKAKPTEGRWASFGVRLEPFVLREAPTIDTSRAEWVTYRHPREASGATNFSAFERVNIQTFFGETR